MIDDENMIEDNRISAEKDRKQRPKTATKSTRQRSKRVRKVDIKDRKRFKARNRDQKRVREKLTIERDTGGLFVPGFARKIRHSLVFMS